MRHFLPCVILLVAAAACDEQQSSGSDAAPATDARTPADGPSVGDGPSAGDGAPTADTRAPDDTGPAVNPYANARCGAAPPSGAQLAAAPKPYSGGVCPTLKSGTNVITSEGVQRQFELLMPATIQPGEKLPLLFALHWLKGKASSFVEQGELAQATEEQRFIAVAPEAKGDLDLFGQTEVPWPFLTTDSDARMNEEYRFFDDMLACVSEQLPVDKECVTAVGVSAGALYGVQLAAARSEYLSSFMSLSGGVGTTGVVNQFVRDFSAPAHKLPMLVLWGGPQDSCVLLNFENASRKLEQQLTQGGHFFVECIHNCMHGVPPIVPPPGKSKFFPIWSFAWAHPFWLPAGASPFAQGLPADYVPWCAVGAGATIRTGACDDPGCPI